MTDYALPTHEARAPRRPWGSALRAYLEAPVSGQSLAAVRIAFGGILAWDWWRYVDNTRITRYYVEPDVLFPFLPFVHALPEPWIHILWGGVGVFGVLVMLGLFYRVSIVALTGIFAYFFLLDRTQYLNHNYMVILYGALLCFMPAHRTFSLDAWLWPKLRSRVIPRWPVAALKAQTEIILIYAGLVKITDDWLRGEPLRSWLPRREDEIFYGFLFQYDWAIVTGAWATVGLHVLGAPLLLWRRTRLAAFLVYAFFHWSNAQLFNIGIFPWITLALTTIFFAPDWPERLWQSAARWMDRTPAVRTSAPASVMPTFRIGPALSVFLGVWFAVQIVVPQRQMLWSTDVGWSGDGHRFSWRMRIYDRHAEGVFRVVDRAGQVWEVNPREIMVRRRARNILSRPDLVHAFAILLEERWLEAGYGDVAVYADIEKEFNGRPMQPFTDPTIDLTEAGYNWLRPNGWVLPNQYRAAEGLLPDGFPGLPFSL